MEKETKVKTQVVPCEPGWYAIFRFRDTWEMARVCAWHMYPHTNKEDVVGYPVCSARSTIGTTLNLHSIAFFPELTRSIYSLSEDDVVKMNLTGQQLPNGFLSELQPDDIPY